MLGSDGDGRRRRRHCYVHVKCTRIHAHGNLHVRGHIGNRRRTEAGFSIVIHHRKKEGRMHPGDWQSESSWCHRVPFWVLHDR